MINTVPSAPTPGSSLGAALTDSPRRATHAKHRIDVVDAFRGIAIVAVLCYHYLVRWAPPFSTVDLYGYAHTYPPFLELGGLGVQVFFVISGLVIAITLADCQGAIEFAIKRFARLYPAYVVAATLTFVLMRIAGPDAFKVTVTDYIYNFSMLSSSFQHRLWVDGAYWSLAVEIKFYVAAAIGFALFRGQFWKFLVGVAIFGTVLEQFKPAFTQNWLVPQYMPMFIAGIAVWLAALANRRREGAIVMIVAIALYGFNENLIAATHQNSHWAADAFIIGLAGAMAFMLHRYPAARLGPLALVGKLSYSVYLLHQFIGVTVIHALTTRGVPDGAAMTTAVVLAGALGWASYTWVEQPARKMVLAWSAPILRLGRAGVRLDRPDSQTTAAPSLQSVS